jgi:hypothetical protein
VFQGGVFAVAGTFFACVNMIKPYFEDSSVCVDMMMIDHCVAVS